MPQQNFDRSVLLFCNDQKADSPIIRQMIIQTDPMFLYSIGTIADADIYRILQHMIPIFQQKIPESDGIMPLLFCFNRQVKENDQSNESIHTYVAAMAPDEEGTSLYCRCASFVPAAPWRRRRYTAAFRKEYPDSTS